MAKFKSRRGAVLLQTVVMSLILAIISIGITRWILNRHMSAVRLARSAEARTTAGGSGMKQVSIWLGGTPPNANGTITIGTGPKQRTMNYTYDASTNKMVISYDEEQ